MKSNPLRVSLIFIIHVANLYWLAWGYFCHCVSHKQAIYSNPPFILSFIALFPVQNCLFFISHIFHRFISPLKVLFFLLSLSHLFPHPHGINFNSWILLMASLIIVSSFRCFQFWILYLCCLLLSSLNLDSCNCFSIPRYASLISIIFDSN